MFSSQCPHQENLNHQYLFTAPGIQCPLLACWCSITEMHRLPHRNTCTHIIKILTLNEIYSPTMLKPCGQPIYGGSLELGHIEFHGVSQWGWLTRSLPHNLKFKIAFLFKMEMEEVCVVLHFTTQIKIRHRCYSDASFLCIARVWQIPSNKTHTNKRNKISLNKGLHSTEVFRNEVPKIK